MQMMPKISWPHRVPSDAIVRDVIASVVLVVTVSSIPRILLVARSRDLGPRLRRLTLRRQRFTDAPKQLVAAWLPPRVILRRWLHNQCLQVNEHRPAAMLPPIGSNSFSKLHAGLQKTNRPEWRDFRICGRTAGTQ